eukprot:6288125-Amphidinium_carterae.1
MSLLGYKAKPTALRLGKGSENTAMRVAVFLSRDKGTTMHGPRTHRDTEKESMRLFPPKKQ